MHKLKKIFKNLNFNFKILETTTFNILMDQYLNSINDESMVLIEELYSCVKDNYFDNKSILFHEMRINDDNYYLIALFIYKSISKSNLIYNSHTNYLTNDEVLNTIIDNYKNLYIFYLKKEITSARILEIRGELFKIINILILNKIIYSKKSYINNKTIEYLSFNFDKIYLSDAENLKISPVPLKLVLIEENYYLIGDFFTLIKKVFIENTLSNYYFKLNNMGYLERLIQAKNYINIYDLEDALKIIEKEHFIFNDAPIIINNSKSKINENMNKIKNKNKELKKTILEPLNIENLSFVEIKKNIINKFLSYVKSLSETRDFILDDKNDTNFLNLLYTEFLVIFNNAYFKIKLDNLKEFLDWKTKLKEFGYTEENEYVGKFKKILSPIKKIKIDQKINPKKISFLSYLFILNKKEINSAITKTINKINANISSNEILVNSNEIEFEEDTYLDKYKISVISLIKFDIKSKNNLELYKIKLEIQQLIKENAKLQSDISKISNLYNIYILYNYCRNNFQKDNWGNVSVYFMIFFDFRGRYYYDSIISPTNNKISRFIFNYGIFDKNDLNYSANEISTIIQSYENYINEFKIIFNITNNSTWMNDTIFWIMISISKLSIKKKKKIEIKEFLENSLETLKNPKITDIIDKIEYNYLLKIADSLRNEKILKRVLLKDATASFFQNLIRILGPKNEEISKIANLNSTTTWYDWYTYVLEKWLENEKKQDLITENHKYFTRKTTKRTDMTISYEASFPTLIEYFEEDLLEHFNISLNDEITQIFIRFYKFVKDNFKNNPDFLKNPSTLDNEFKNLLNADKNIIMISRLNDKSNLTYYKTHTKHFDFIIKVENTRKRIIKNYKQLKDEIDNRKSMIALKANLVHFVDAMLIRDINTFIYYFNKKMYIAIHDSFMVDFTEVSEFIIIANQCANQNPFNEDLVNYDKKFFSLFIFI